MVDKPFLRRKLLIHKVPLKDGRKKGIGGRVEGNKRAQEGKMEEKKETKNEQRERGRTDDRKKERKGKWMEGKKEIIITLFWLSDSVQV